MGKLDSSRPLFTITSRMRQACRNKEGFKATKTTKKNSGRIRNKNKKKWKKERCQTI